MNNNKKMIILLLGLLVSGLTTSIGLNVFLFRQGKLYYEQLNATRLDPLGLSVYPEKNSARAGDQEKRVVFFGDSRAAMWSAPENLSGFEFINRGIGSQTSAQVLARYDADVRPLEPDILVIQVGINDLKTIPLFPDQKASIIANCKTNLQKIVEMALEQNSLVILTTIIPEGQLPLERSLFWSGDVGEAVREVNKFLFTLRSEKVKLLDTEKVLADESGMIKKGYRFDFLHLNEQGYQTLNNELVLLLLQFKK